MVLCIFSVEDLRFMLSKKNNLKETYDYEYAAGKGSQLSGRFT